MISQHAVFYREAQGMRLSNIGIGTYLGALDEATDRGYTESVITAVRLGINVIDTSLNYRNQRSECAVGEALRRLFAAGEARRDDLLVCTKAGFLVRDAMPAALRPEEVVDGGHSMAPAFLADQLERSRQNLGLDSIDVFYLHNPELQLNRVGRDEFHARIHRAFTFLEEAVAQGKIRFYGTATWDGYRRTDGLSLAAIAAEAERAGGNEHHFRFIQLPFNLAMPEAYVQRLDGETVLKAASRLGITAIASATLLQTRLARDLPAELAAKLPGATTDAQRAIQFTRSTPVITTALVGMSKPEHVRENLELAAIPPLSEPEYRALYRQA